MQRTFICLLLCPVFLATCLTISYGEDLVTAAVERFRVDLSYLASDELKGRDSGSEGIREAGEFIANRFYELGLRTDSFDGDPFQVFRLSSSAQVGPQEQNYLRFEGLDQEVSLSVGQSFNPLALGADEGQFAGGLVFAGYGITAEDLGYDDYANINVEGKVVIVIRKEPQQEVEGSVFDGKKNTAHAYFSSKEVNAARHKAAAMILVNDSVTISQSGDQILSISGGGGGRRMPGPRIPTYFCSTSVIDPIVKQGMGKTLSELAQEIDVDLQPRSKLFDGISASGEVKLEQRQLPARNVIALLPGTGELADQYVVVGAHYDHVGMGQRGSLAPGTIAVHNGADDNASGTATMLEVARRMAATESASRRAIVFMAFSGEEKGLLGSKHYVRNPRWPLEETVAMVNLDMVGRLRENTLTVYGTGTSPMFDDLMDRVNENVEFNLSKQTAGRGPSDHQSFYEKNIPVFHFFTGLHNDYHRPSDDFDKINYQGMARIAAMITELVTELSTREERPAFTKTRGTANVWATMRPSRRRAIMGISLDLQGSGATVASVNPDGPADKAGLQVGDVIVEIAADSIASIQDLQASLADRKPGDVIAIKLKRGEETIEVDVTLEQQ